MRLVNDDGVVGIEQRVGLCFGQQDAVGHQLDGSVPAQAVLKPHLEAHHVAQRCFQLFSNAFGHAGCGDAPGLGVADEFAALPSWVVQLAAPHRQQDFRQLGGFARTGFAANNHHLMGGNGNANFFALARYRQRFRKVDFQQGRCFSRQGGSAQSFVLSTPPRDDALHQPGIRQLDRFTARMVKPGNTAGIADRCA